jgi:hypothetical protein
MGTFFLLPKKDFEKEREEMDGSDGREHQSYHGTGWQQEMRTGSESELNENQVSKFAHSTSQE